VQVFSTAKLTKDTKISQDSQSVVSFAVNIFQRKKRKGFQNIRSALRPLRHLFHSEKVVHSMI